MENGLQESDRVLAVCTNNYIDKSNGGIGGVGYENTFVTAELLLNQATTKFIPVVRSVSKPMKTPLCLSGRMYIDFSADNNYEDSLNQLVHEVYGIKQRPKPKLGNNPFLESSNQKPKLHENSTTFFYKRFSLAFPGVRGIDWFEKDQAIERLLILLKEPLVFENHTPIWWWRSGDLQIENFDRIGEGLALMDGQELKITKIAAVNSGSYYQSFVYVEVEAMEPSGLYDIDIDADISYWGYSREEFGVYEGRNITRAEYDDNATVIDGKPVYMNSKAEIRVRYLTPYNFIIAPHNSPINNSGYDSRRNEALNEILNGQLTIEEFAKEILRLPKRSY